MSRKDKIRLKPFARELRREMTREERHLWYDFLKSFPVMVNRQKIIGPYIVDFYIARAKIVIELDGAQHYTEEGIAYDRRRDRYLGERGILVLRFLNSEVNQYFEGVCEVILRECLKRTGGPPHPSSGI